MILLAVLAGIVALVHTPPHPAFSITEACCPRRTTTETFQTEWLLGLASSLLTTTLCIVLALLARYEKLKATIWVGAGAAFSSLFFASDLAFSMNLGGFALSFNLGLIALAAFVTSIVINVRARTLRA